MLNRRSIVFSMRRGWHKHAAILWRMIHDCLITSDLHVYMYDYMFGVVVETGCHNNNKNFMLKSYKKVLIEFRFIKALRNGA